MVRNNCDSEALVNIANLVVQELKLVYCNFCTKAVRICQLLLKTLLNRKCFACRCLHVCFLSAFHMSWLHIILCIYTYISGGMKPNTGCRYIQRTFFWWVEDGSLLYQVLNWKENYFEQLFPEGCSNSHMLIQKTSYRVKYFMGDHTNNWWVS